MKRRKKILISTVIASLACLGLMFQHKATAVGAADQEDETETAIQEKELAVQPFAENILANPTFKRGKNSENQTILTDWTMYENSASVTGGNNELVIGTESMGYQNNYDKLIKENGNATGFGTIGLSKTDNEKLEADLTGYGHGKGVALIVAQTMTTIPGKLYTFSADTWSSGASRRTISIYNGTAVAGTGGEALTTSEQGNQTISAAFVAKSTQTTMSVRLYADKGQNVRANMSNLTVIEQDPWIPSYSKWLDSTTNAIPKGNTFLLREMEDTEIVETEGLSPDPENASRYIYDSVEPNVPRSIKFKNVGYYDGESISTKVTLTPNFDPEKSKSNYITVTGNSFLTVGVAGATGSKTDVKFEFFDQNDQPIALSGYWNFSNLNTSKSVAIPTEQIEHVYSVDRQYDPPIGINYTMDDQKLVLSGQVEGTSATAADRQLSMTYSDQIDFSYTIITRSTKGMNVAYPTAPIVKVEIPDPQGINQKVPEVTKDNETQLNYQFIQQIPFETPANSDQQMSWKLTSSTANNALSQSVWVVTDEAGVDRTNLFTFNVDSLGNGTVTPVDIKNTALYNHYYLFERKLLFSGTEVAENTLIDKDGGRYLDYTANVELTVDSLAPVKSNFSTSINLASTIDYRYLLTGTQTPVPDSETQPKQVTGLITHPYPINQAPTLEDYQLVSQVPKNVDAAKVRYTNEQVDFNYELVAGAISLSVPKTLAFKEASVPVSKQTTVPRVEPDWMLKVTDQRAKTLRGQWQVTVRLKEPFKNNKDQTLDSVLKFKTAANKPEYTLDAVNSVPVYQSQTKPDKVTDQEISWAADAGFYLDFDSYGYYPAGDYQAVVEFSLESVPTP